MFALDALANKHPLSCRRPHENYFKNYKKLAKKSKIIQIIQLPAWLTRLWALHLVQCFKVPFKSSNWLEMTLHWPWTRILTWKLKFEPARIRISRRPIQAVAIDRQDIPLFISSLDIFTESILVLKIRLVHKWQWLPSFQTTLGTLKLLNVLGVYEIIYGIKEGGFSLVII